MSTTILDLHGVRVRFHRQRSQITIEDHGRPTSFGWPATAAALQQGQLVDEVDRNRSWAVHRLEGYEPLSDAMDRCRTVEELAGWFLALVDALESYHRAGLLHLFLRPELVWVTPSGRVRFVGVVRSLAPAHLDQRPIECLIDPYLAPELVRPWTDEVPDHRTDYFALGTVFSWMVARAVSAGVHLSARRTDTWDRLLRCMVHPNRRARPGDAAQIRALVEGWALKQDEVPPDPWDPLAQRMAAAVHPNEQLPWVVVRHLSPASVPGLLRALGDRTDPGRTIFLRVDLASSPTPEAGLAELWLQLQQLVALLPRRRRHHLSANLVRADRLLTWLEVYPCLSMIAQAGHRCFVVLENLQQASPPWADQLLLFRLLRPSDPVIAFWRQDQEARWTWDEASSSLGWSRMGLFTEALDQEVEAPSHPQPWHLRRGVPVPRLRIAPPSDPIDLWNRFFSGQCLTLSVDQLAAQLLESLVRFPGEPWNKTRRLIPFYWAAAAFHAGMPGHQLRNTLQILRHRPGLQHLDRVNLDEVATLYGRLGENRSTHVSALQRAFFEDDWESAVDPTPLEGAVEINFALVLGSTARLLARWIGAGDSSARHGRADQVAWELLDRASQSHPLTFEPMRALVEAVGHPMPEVGLVAVEKVVHRLRQNQRIPVLVMGLRILEVLAERVGLPHWQVAWREERLQLIDRWMGPVSAPAQRPSEGPGAHLTGVDVGAVLVALERDFEQHRVYEDSGFRLSDLADRLGLRPRQLSELLSRYRNTSFPDLVASYRVERAKELLVRRPDLSVLDIAFRVGYQNSSTFYDAFRRREGTSPQAWLKAHKDLPYR